MQNFQEPFLLIGVDGGGSRTRLLLANAVGEIIASGEGGACNVRLGAQKCWESVHEALHAASLQAGLPWPLPSSLQLHAALGLAGTEDNDALQAFLSTPPPFATLHVISDAEAACLGAHAGADGAIIVIGTGVIGYQRMQGVCQRVSGYGFFYDDQGSGAWLGREACQWVLRIHDRRSPRVSQLVEAILQQHSNFDAFLNWLYAAKAAEFAALVPLIVALQYVDALARELLQEAAQHIAAIHSALRMKQRERGIELPFALMGGAEKAIYPYLAADITTHLVAVKESAERGVLRLLSSMVPRHM